MRAVELVVSKGMSLRKALGYSGLSSQTYYYKPIPRVSRRPDPVIVDKVKEMALRHPSHGARRVVAMMRRELAFL